MTNNNHGGKRPGAGAPHVPKDEKKINIAIYLERGLIKEYASRFNLDYDGTMRSAMKKVKADLKEFFYEMLKDPVEETK